MNALLVALAVVSGGTDTLAKASINKLTFKAPTSWTAASDDEASKTWTAPEDAASLSVSAYPVDPVRPAQACVNEMLEKLGKDGFEAAKLGGQPAQKKVETNYLGDADAGQSEENKVTSTTVIGCNGKVRWVMTWTAKASLGARFGPMLKRVLDSVSYGK
ncbi:MAG: hypothetical protein AMXMBFR34_39800 [Myxococcaceae bacterium]